ncbi:DUF1727 domain-containing protein [Salinifilum ghardaiensis]
MTDRARDRTSRGALGTGARGETSREGEQAVPSPAPPSEPSTPAPSRPPEQAPEHREWRVVPARRRTDPRTALAVQLGRATALLSRLTRFGSGGMIGGRVALTVQPDLLRRLSRARRVVMVTGTNGKTTTTQLTAEALRSLAPAVSNATGANMPDGHVTALMSNRRAPFAALEVDELHLARVTEQIEPAVIVLLNLSRDQLDRVGEVRTVAASLRRALERAPNTRVIANRDDPNIVLAVAEHDAVTWVAAGVHWRDDAWNCPRCGTFLGELDEAWECVCGLRRPEADWSVTDRGVVGPEGAEHSLDLRLPGHVNRVNATFALAAGAELGGDEDAMLGRIRTMHQASGRYGVVRLAGRRARLLLAKNPASWLEMLHLVAENDRPLLLVVNSREADGHDVSWLWDVDFGLLAGRTVWVSGERAYDVAVRLRYAGVTCNVAGSPHQALSAVPGDEPDVLANYTAFRDLLAHKGAA